MKLGDWVGVSAGVEDEMVLIGGKNMVRNNWELFRKSVLIIAPSEARYWNRLLSKTKGEPWI